MERRNKRVLLHGKLKGGGKTKKNPNHINGTVYSASSNLGAQRIVIIMYGVTKRNEPDFLGGNEWLRSLLIHSRCTGHSRLFAAYTAHHLTRRWVYGKK